MSKVRGFSGTVRIRGGLAVFLVLVVLPLGGQNAPKPNGHTTHTDNGQNSPNPTTTIINQKNAYATQNNTADKNEGSAKSKHDYVLWGFFVNLVLAGATLIIAIFAVVQARVAKDSIEMIIQKERAKIVVDLKPLNLTNRTSGGAYSVEFLITAHGTTAAYISENNCAMYVSDEGHIDFPDAGSAVMFPIFGWEKVLSPNSPVEGNTFLFIEDPDELNAINQSKLFVGVRGRIKYKDAFDRNRETSFRYVWKFSLYGGGHWEQRRTEENQTT